MAINDHPRTLIFFGFSGAGKGTQAKLVAEYLRKSDPHRETLYLSTGSLFRSFMDTGTYTARRVRRILDEGGLPLEFLAITLWTQYFNERVTAGTEHLILDGVARRYAEAPILEHALAFYGRVEHTDVIVINVSRAWATARLKERGRYDDTDEEIKKRLDWFEKEVSQSIDYFQNDSTCRVHDINGEQTIEEVHADVVRLINAP